jgi:predicted PurR-regulated permease PerM
MAPERVVIFRPRTVLTVLGLVLAVAVALEVIWISRQVISWVLIAAFLAVAINPLVELLQRHGVRRRGAAVAIAYVGVIAVIAAIAATFIPTLVGQVTDFANKVPDYVHDITKGRGRLGFLETKYHLRERIQEQVNQGGVKKILGFSGTALAVTKGVITMVVAALTIAFMTLFMLLEGPAWVERIYGLVPERSQARARGIGRDIYRTVGGYVTGNLLISLIAGISTTLVLLVMGVPYAVALGLIVALLDLIPLAGATIAAIVVSAVAFIHSVPAGIVVLVFFVLYQQLENHVLQPVVYGRTVQLSPLAVLISVLIGAQLAGVLGALGAIPVAGAIQVILVDWQRSRRARLVEGVPQVPAAQETP